MTTELPDTVIIARIMAGDKKIFTDVSRWTIQMLWQAGYLKGAPDSVKCEISNVLDDCDSSW